MKKQFEEYRPFGQPASGWVRIDGDLITGNKITLNGVDFVYGTDFFGTSPATILKSLEDTINGNASSSYNTANIVVVRSTYAVMIANYVVIIATIPGVGGNSIALTTNASAKITLSGSTLSGGNGPVAADGTIAFTSVPYAWTSANDTVTTSATGTNRVTLASHTAKEVVINNTAGTDLEFRRGGAGTAFVLSDGQAKTFRLTTNTSELDVRRVDTSNTQVTIAYEYAS